MKYNFEMRTVLGDFCDVQLLHVLRHFDVGPERQAAPTSSSRHWKIPKQHALLRLTIPIPMQPRMNSVCTNME